MDKVFVVYTEKELKEAIKRGKKHIVLNEIHIIKKGSSK